MATVRAASMASSLIARPAGLSQRRPLAVACSHVLGLPAASTKGRVSCKTEGKPSPSSETSGTGKSASLVAAICAAATMSGPALALVDERMSTEGTGLPFGLSNNLLGWILFGVFGLIWALYFIYTSGLEEDEESGLSL
ncbi:hypothetical protein SAY87_000836 [Trapa incisa]|uniref:PSII 6.1 kDa protein n=2 Tax=Trapa TaxID=22665 RepID=A0AAN7RFP4_TRANT|nr:hypothetical protein SAY87_000836 [Trapa incisa]KAK4801020.1 hypothetical protein SAY86_021507 [Trapa natans]